MSKNIGMGPAWQKREIACRLLLAAGNIVEFWGEQPGDEDIDADFVRECLARWLKDLPGDYWDVRLGEAP